MEKSNQNLFHELSFYTLAHPDMVYFMHQHVVDAYQAQMAEDNTKPIGLTFSLIGLYLYLEKGYTGRQVQQAHMKLAQNKKAWPRLDLPVKRGDITVADVLKVAPGETRDEKIKDWCASVWAAYENWHRTIGELASTELGIK